jgi:hypothetical protein
MQWRSVVIVAVCVGLGLSAGAGPTDVPRILVVGDSWGAFMQLFRCFDVAMPDYPGLNGSGQRGQRTTLVGGRASEFDTPGVLQVIQDELLSYPTIDIVHLSLGGNDVLLDSGWTPSMPPDQVQAMIDAVNAHTESVIDYILAIRPNLRVALCGYDFVNHVMGGATIQQVNAVFVQFEQSRLALAQRKPRVFYVHNLGLMQYYYGIPLAVPPIPPRQVPMPGGYAENYVPMPGGDPNYATPLEALMDQDIHLTMQGYDILAHRCIDEFYGTWLSSPVVLEVLPLDGSQAPLQRFQVTFSKPVTGVDQTDFAASGAKTASVVSVDGSGAVYTVTVDLGGDPGPAHLTVLDDDSIIDADHRPLGGPGVGNGGFDSNGPLAYADPALTGTDDFDEAFWSLDRTFLAVSWMLGGQQFDPEHCDTNSGSISVYPPQILGNGMLDSAELGLIYACLHDESLDLSATGGVTHAVVETAWQQNFSRMQSDLGGANGRITTAIEGLDTLLAGLMTLGDPASASVPMLLMAAISTFIPLPPGATIPNPANYTLPGNFFGPDGDADGDGFTSRKEYEYFMPIGGKALYVMAALDPAMTPEIRCTNATGGTYNEGDPFCLSIPDAVNLGGGFEWLKDGSTLANDAVLSGSRWRELHIRHLRPSDAGAYECVYDNGAKIFGPVMVNINAMPAARSAGFATLALSVAAFGALLMRRNGHPIPDQDTSSASCALGFSRSESSM